MKKNKKIISIILTSFMIFSIVVSSLVPTISSYAVENEGTEVTGSLVDYYNLPSSIMSNTDLEQNFNFLFKNQYFDNINGFYVNNKSNFNAPTGFLDYGSYLCFYNNGFVFGSFPSDSFIICNESTWRLYVDADFIKSKGTTYQFYYQFNDNLVYTNKVSSNFYAPTSTGVSIDDGFYYYEGRTTNFIFCDIPMYYSDNLQPSTLDGLTNFNPNYLGDSNEDILNHLTLRDDTKFYLSNTSFDNGTLYLYPVLDQTQLRSNESLDQYYFRFVGSVSTSTTYNKNNTEYYAKAPNGSRITNCFPMSVTGSNPYNFTLTSTEGNYYDVPVNDATNGTWSIGLKELNNMFYSNTDYTYHYLAYGYDSLYSGTSFFNTFDYAMSGLSVLGNSFDSTKALNQQTKCDVVPTSVYYHIDLYIVKKNIQTDEESIGSVQCYIDGDICNGGLTGQNVNTSSDEDIRNATGEDYVPKDYASGGSNTNYKDTYNNVGGSGGSADNNSSNSTTGGSASIGDGAIVINNNPTFNNDVSASSESKTSGFGSFLSTLITLIASGKTSSVDTISEISGTTGYTELVTSYIGTIPASLWTTILVTFTACLGISIIAFIISLLFKIFF